MDQVMFEHFLLHYEFKNIPSSWFCSFDDDNYVIVDNLLNVLREYQKSNATKLYVRRPSQVKGMAWRHLEGKPTLHF